MADPLLCGCARALVLVDVALEDGGLVVAERWSCGAHGWWVRHPAPGAAPGADWP